ncbi:putative DNA-directed RNA polymerase [Erwinia phage pEa_SNUABM_5]|uniref:Putative DNA-directed RNA polymerase n=1 Tax=Erwinia phage pEa_SNUABM_5 TaxID=2797313 RepID=A0A7T8EP90_9CAUD|nr:putative DNA-directed RNA polymerase [Erwinia phage pEa_SNUABM_5]QQO90146.1 putative DNA-directed RNA polymerase [Erwinia phage pEa_SNUABM_5]
MTTKPKFFNPLLPQTQPSTVKSQSADSDFVSASGAFAIENPNQCPKCNSATVRTDLMDGENVMFCTNCRVSMALKQQ